MTDFDSLSFRRWCLQSLSPQSFLVYEVCYDLGEVLTTFETIAEYANCDPYVAATELVLLQAKGFIRYATLGGNRDVSIDWVRESGDEVPPTFEECERKRRRRHGFILVHDNITYRFPPGATQQFINRFSTWRVQR